MDKYFDLSLVLIATLAIIYLVQAQSQQGFISLDCGLPRNEVSPYNESWETGLEYRSDATFIQSGKTGRIQKSLEPNYLKPSMTLRYFPEGIRNCYNLNVEKGRKHLIRAGFLYGNYDGLNLGPKFDLYLGPNPWATIDLERVNSTREEILHTPTSNSLQICLVKTGDTTPMISTLEIRPMGIGSYITESGSLKFYFRQYFSESENNTIRYPFDAYDRQWKPTFQPEWTEISTTGDFVSVSDFDPFLTKKKKKEKKTNNYDLPKEVVAYAAIPTNGSEPLTIGWTNSEDPNGQYYVYAHFSDVQELQSNETREFNMVWNGEVNDGNYIPPNYVISTVSDSAPSKACDGGKCSFQLIRTDESTLPPLLNALEVFTVIQFPQSDTDKNEVVAITSIKNAYELNRNSWQGDPCVPQHLKWDGLNCSNTDISTPPRITSLNLSSSGLTGTIAAAIQNLTQLEKLDLSNNNLIGDLPEFLGNIKSLMFINLSGNDLSGSIPQALQKKGLELLYQGNPRLGPLGSPTKQPKKKFPVAIVAAVASAGVGIAIAVLILFLVLGKKKSTIVEGLHLPQRTSTMNATFANKNRKRFTYSEVLKMTNNFQRVLGKGGFGMVYHGTVNGSEQVAVKVLSQSSTQGYKEFKAEVDLLLRVHHTNLVSLVGYCYEGDHLALIYELLPNGDVKQHLSGKGGKSIINWSSRLRIALESALGLEYLHIGCKPAMVHRDVKTANILLDENFMAKLADFGLSRSFQGGGESQDSTVIAGTLGYLDPEYNQSGRLGEKSDVYSFGIVLLEMITNQPVINRASANSHITQWVGSKVNRGDINEIMDPNLHNDYDSNSAWRALELAMTCANPSSSKRPSMSQVVHELKECIVCENSAISTNQGLGSEKMTVSLDTLVVSMAR